MNILVLLAGVIDPKWSLVPLADHDRRLDFDRASYPRKLSPFDEAALEVALKLRDADSARRVTGILVGGEKSAPLMQEVRAYRLDETHLLDLDWSALWDVAASAGVLAETVGALAASPELHQHPTERTPP